MSDKKHADGADPSNASDDANLHTDEVLADGSDTDKSEVTEPDKDSLNFEEILSTSKTKLKSSKEVRKGLSRREASELHDKNVDDPDEPDEDNSDKSEDVDDEKEQLKNELAEVKNELSEIKKDVHFIREDRTKKENQELENMIVERLRENEISDSEFNGSYKEKFIQKREFYESKGFTKKEAIEEALEIVIPKIQKEKSDVEKEELTRKEARTNASLPPRGTAKSVIKDEFPQLKREEFENLLSNKCKELGQEAGIAYYKKYCAHQVMKNRKEYRE